MNSKLTLLILTFVLTIIFAAGLYLAFSNFKDLKIFGCTEYDIYEGEGHEKLEPKDLYCNFDLLELAPNSRADDVTVALVEYNLNPIGYITLLALLIFIPFTLAYSIAYFIISKSFKNKDV